MIEERARSVAGELRDCVEREHPGLLRAHPLLACADAFDHLPPSISYTASPDAVRRVWAAIRAGFGEDALRSHCRLLLAHSVERWPSLAGRSGLPESVVEPSAAMLGSILREVERGGSGSEPGSDRFAKNLALARGKLVVCGPEMVDLDAGIPRSAVLRPPRREGPRRLAFLLNRVGGFKPLLESHLDRRLAPEFHPVGYERMYLRLADLLRWNTSLLGFVGGGAWFCDPAVLEFSPELRFVTELPLAHGARLLPAVTSEADVRNATRTSPVRSAAFEAGLYRPRSYRLIWPRRDLLRWASSQG